MREATPLSRPHEPGALSATRADRRPIRSRNALWAQAAASCLARLGVNPNQISLASVLAAGVGGGWLKLLSTAVECDQLRLWRSASPVVQSARRHGRGRAREAESARRPLQRIAGPRLRLSAVRRPWICFWTTVAWVAWRTFGSTHGLHPSLRSSARICSGFSRSHGQAAPHGFVNSWLPHFHRRAFCSSNQSQSGNHVWTDRCGFFADLLDAHPSIGEQVKGAQLTCGSPAPLLWSCAVFAFPIPRARPN